MTTHPNPDRSDSISAPGPSSCIGVIPAKARSTRLPGKNIAVLAGKPLVVHTIDTALQSGVFQTVVVSTDDPAIAEMSRRAGAEVPFRRDESLTRDGVEVDQVVLHALAWYADHQNRKFDWVCILQVTSPLRTVSDVAESYRLLMQNPDADGVVSVSPYHHHPYWAFQIENGFVRPDRPDQVITSRRLLPPLYHPDGVIYWFRAANVLAGRPPYEGRILAYHTPPTSAVDIDEPEDFAYAEFLLNGRNQAANNSTTPS